jgi:hypothetical protein
MIEFLNSLDPAWVGLGGVIAGTILSGFFSGRAARLAAMIALRNAETAASTSSAAAQMQAETATLTARLQHVTARQCAREPRIDETYVGVLRHVENWLHWAHLVNQYNYSQYHWRDSELPLPFSPRPRRDDPRHPLDVLSPDIDKIEKPAGWAPQIELPADLYAVYSIYASDTVRTVFEQWKRGAERTAELGMRVTVAPRRVQECAESKGTNKEVLLEGRLKYPDAVEAPAGSQPAHGPRRPRQGPDRLWGGRAARLSSWVGPAAGDEVSVPAQQGPRRHKPQLAQRGKKQSAECAEDRSVDPGQCRVWVVSA